MITEHDLRAAIAECQGERNPTANTCFKLAAYYIILNNLYPEAEPPQYSYTPAPVATVELDSDSQFAAAIKGKTAASVWPIMDELLTVLQAIKPGLYDGVMRKIDDI